MAVIDGDLSFGALLRTLRRRERLTQQRLAQALGIHRRTLGRWEQGDCLPESKTQVLELARHLHLGEQETRQMLEASLTALTPYWHVPLLRNPYFTGREAILEELHTQLGSEQAVTLTQAFALHGLGGVGKTQIALEYAYRHALDYSAVFWIGAETQEQMIASFLRVAWVLGLPERDDTDQRRVVVAVQHWLSTHREWLLIWDNVEDLDLLQRFLPPTRRGAILLTTRRQTLGTLAQGLDLEPMEQEEGMVFLLRRAKILAPEASGEHVRFLAERTPAQYRAAMALVDVMGGLPLALDQAGAYLEETGCSLQGYLSRYERQQAHLLDRRGNFPGHHPHSVTMTFRLSMHQVEREPHAADLLRVCALLEADAIPEELFEEGAEYLGPAFAGFSSDPTLLDTALATLRRWSLIQRQAETRTLSLHRLVQVVLREEMPEALQRTWMTYILQTLRLLFPGDELLEQAGDLRRCERLLPHALVALAWPEQEQEQVPKRLALMNHVAKYLRFRARFAEAEALYQRALLCGEHAPWSDPLLVVETLEGLADLQTQQAHFAQAEPLYRRALQIEEQVLGNEHVQVATSLRKLALLFGRQARYPEAEALYRRALPIQEQVLGSEHLEIATSLNGLARILHAQGSYGEAERLYQRALSICERARGGEHPYVAIYLRNLAELFLDQNKDEAAQPLYLRALEILEKVFGPEDTDVGLPLNGLAHLSMKGGKDEEAASFFRRALQIWETGFGPNHPRVAEPLVGLANLAVKQGKAHQAEQFFQRALSLQEQHLGPQHPQMADTLSDLALFRQKQGNLSEALALTNRALLIRSQVLGNEHPKTIATRTLSTQLLREQTAAMKNAISKQEGEATPDPSREALQASASWLPLHQSIDASSRAHDPLQAFLEACCDLHPRAWCRSADLWQAYEQWSRAHQERYPLSRSAFTQQLKAAGCQADRTNSARIWRGIALVSREIVTGSDGE